MHTNCFYAQLPLPFYPAPAGVNFYRLRALPCKPILLQTTSPRAFAARGCGLFARRPKSGLPTHLPLWGGCFRGFFALQCGL